MDIKDYILIGGGLLIAAVIAHGFWIAWRSRQEPLRIDIQPDLIPDAMTDMERLRGELPNGGARIVNASSGRGRNSSQAKQEPLPLLLEPSEGPPETPRRSASPTLSGGRDTAARRSPEPTDAAMARRAQRSDPRTEPLLYDDAAIDDDELVRAEVTDVALPESRPEPAGAAEKPLRTDAQSRTAARKVERRSEASRRNGDRKTPERAAEKSAPAEELIVMNVFAETGKPYTGDAIFAVLRGKGMKFGDMNIFHRVDPLTKAIHFSIANVVEPGTFDMADMEAFRAPGLCFFMQLPGPENPSEAFEDLLDVADAVVSQLGGEISDEQRNRVTLQTVEHYRQRIAEFSRRRMFLRA